MKSRLPMVYFSVIQSFWNFAQSTSMILPFYMVYPVLHSTLGWLQCYREVRRPYSIVTRVAMWLQYNGEWRGKQADHIVMGPEWPWDYRAIETKEGTVWDSKDHGANMGPTWVLSTPGGPHVGPMNLAIRGAMEKSVDCIACQSASW